MANLYLRIHERLSTILKKAIYSESLFNTLYIEIKRMLKQFPSDKTLHKMYPFFFHELKFITVLLLIHNSYTSWSTRFIYKVYIFFKLKVCPIWLFDNYFQNKNNRKARHDFSLKPLIFKLQQEVWKFNNICISWKSQNLNWRRNC